MLWALPVAILAYLFRPSVTGALASTLPMTNQVYGPPQQYGPLSKTQRLMRAAVPLLDVIGQHESRNDYSIVYGGARHPLTTMTISQVYELQDSLVRKNRVSSAVGRYQIIKKTMQALVRQMGLNPTRTLFDVQTQDRMAFQLLINRGFEKFIDGKISKATFARNLSMEWASLPKDASGLTYYNDGINRALVSYNTVLSFLDVAKNNYGVA